MSSSKFYLSIIFNHLSFPTDFWTMFLDRIIVLRSTKDFDPGTFLSCDDYI